VTHISRFNAWARAAGLALLMCAVPLAAPAQEPVGRKGDRSVAEQKMDSALIDLTRAAGSGQLRNAASRQALPAYVQDFAERHVAPDQTIFVVIKGKVSDTLTAFIRSRGGTELSAFPQYDTITARVPVSELSAIANRPDVRTVGPREEATTNRLELPPEVLREKLKNLPQPGAATNAGSATWEGVAAHKANAAHSAGRTGTGTMVCVLSDGVNSLAARQATGDLPATVTVLPGQAGSGDEGTAMLEIVHDMAPGASLGYATAFTSVASFATNIVNLQAAGCNIIVDDVTYFNEGAFQDGPIAQAVNQVTAAGALYFSSAANSGNKNDNQSGTFEGDFVASGNAIPSAIQSIYGAASIQLHAFGSNNYTTLTAQTRYVSLKWSDPLGGSSNNYDLIVTNAAGTAVLGQSTNSQTGTQDPYEITYRASQFPSGARIYIVRHSGSARALRLDTHRGRITPADSTAGSTFGHNAAASGISVAAVSLTTATGPGGTFTGGAANPVETYSSDGPRKIFYHPNGTAITPGNLLFATNGGTTLPKVDMAAGDCGTTTTPGFTTFCGTSAAAPTAAAIAALIKGANPGWTNAQIVAAMNASALDIEAAGWDRDSGVGIVMVPASLSSFTIGGNVSGLGAGKSVVLLNNGGDALTRNANGSFTFATPLANGAAYAVTVGTQPVGQTCTVSNGTGTVASANVTNVTVNCTSNTYTIGGSVSGLGAGNSVVLLNNGGDALTRNANGSFTFATPIASGATYSVTVGTQPVGQTCSVSNGTGTVVASNVTNVAVSCVNLPPVTYTIGGNLSGLSAGNSVVLLNNGGDALTRNANGSFTFATPLANGAAYAVTVGTQPVGQTCSVSNGTGTVASANVTNVTVNCTNNTYSIGGSVSGLGAGNSVVLLNNGGDALTRNANGSFTFATPIASGATYSVTVGTQPVGQTCSVSNGTGTVVASNVTNVAVSCVNLPPVTYTIGGNLSGLSAGNSVVLLNNGGDALTRNANGSFTFATPLANGAAYAVTVGTQPVGQTCSVSNGTGTVAAANVTNVAVNCVNVPTYTIGGSVSGLVTGKTVGLLNNGGDALTVNANGSFTFATALTSGSAYAVTVGTQPVGQVCTVSNGTGTVASANVTNVAVSCVNMISGPTSTGTGTATGTLTGGGAACGFAAGSGFVGTPAPPPAGVSFPHGFFGFTATSCPAANGAVTVTITYPTAIPPGAQYYKWGKEAGNTTDHYYTIPATISGNQVSFTITDGQLGDNDLAANGTITDPGAIGVTAAAAGVAPIPTTSEYVLMALAMLMLLAAASPLRARRGTRR